MIYFDSAATTLQKPPTVARAMHYALKHCAGVGRGGHEAAREAASQVFSCRKLAGQLFDAEPEQVVFTMNATHGLNIAIASLVPPGGRAVISGFEHNAVTRPLYSRQAELSVVGRRLFCPEQLLTELEAQLRTHPSAAIFTQVSNVFGYVLPMEQIAALCRAYEVPLVIDASQGAGILPLSLKKTGAAFIAMPGHKGLYGPQGTGLLLCGDGAEPLLYGGTGGNSLAREMPSFLPDRLEAGTHNVCGIAGLRAGLRFVAEKTPEALLRGERRLMERLCRGLEAQPRVELFTGKPQAGPISLRIENTDCEEAAQRLSEGGIALRAGLHCAALAHESAGTAQSGTLRLSLSAFNTMQEVEQFLRLWKKLFTG